MGNSFRFAALGRETVQILDAGCYQSASGARVSIKKALSEAVGNTITYPPEVTVPLPGPGNFRTVIQVEKATTLETARRLAGTGVNVGALNFASATHPGGGFLSGAQAQEESLARSSGLYACIAHTPLYDFHRSRHDPMYTDSIIYSPGVPVFRTDEGKLMDEPYLCSFLTSPAVNARVVLERNPDRRPEIREAMKNRIEKMLAVAALHRHDWLILGAWGCGAFGNDCSEIAGLFHDALTGQFRGVFEQIIFAITDRSKERRFIGPFLGQFAQS
jgi:uncharacterized protein (TIGR02452 family)